MTKILILFTCFNRKEKTKVCLESLAQNQNCKMSYIVLDDNSGDGTQEMLNIQENIVVLHGNGASFYSGGMRQAIEKAKSVDLTQYDYIMFINDDVCFFDGAIDRLVKYENDKEKIIVGAVCSSSGEFSYGGVRKASRFKPSFKNVLIDEKDLSCDTCCANCVLIPRKVFQQLPNIDSVYHHAMGDFDYFFEAKREGFIIESSNFYVGECNDNPVGGGWRDPTLSRKLRLKKKESAKGLPSKEWFHYLRKNHNLLTAVFYSLTPYVRIMLKK